MNHNEMMMKGLKLATLTIAFLSACEMGASPARAGFDITGVALGPEVDGQSSTINGITYRNQTLPLTGVTANGVDWVQGASGPYDVIVRRGGYAPQDSFGNYNTRQPILGEVLPGDPATTVRIPFPTGPSVLSKNNILAGADNVFVNAGFTFNGAPLDIQSDIERVDFVVRNGVLTSPNRGIAVFDLGLKTNHDPFQIAPILSIDGNGNPTSYGTPLSIPIGWGQTNLRPGGGPNDNLNFTVLTNSTGPFSNVLSVTQQIGGLLIPLSELSPGPTTIFGYSLFAPDVNDGGNPASLLDWANPSVYPQTTPNAVGGIDLIATNTGILQAVPEPSSLVSILLYSIVIATLEFKKRWKRSLSHGGDEQRVSEPVEL